MLKEKFGICPYEENYNEKGIIKINIEESSSELLDQSEGELNKELNKELNTESDKQASDEELIEIINPIKDEDTPD